MWGRTARAARWAVGVDDPSTIVAVSPDAAAATVATIKAAWRDAGRDQAPHVSASLWFALGPDAEDQLRGYVTTYMALAGAEIAGWMAGAAEVHSADALRAAVAACAAAGYDELFLVPTTTDVTELDRAREALGV